MKLKILFVALAVFTLISCGNKTEKDESKQKKTVALTPQQAAENYCQCQNELLELTKQETPDIRAKMQECKEMQAAYDKKYMSDPKLQDAFMDAYFACMPNNASDDAESDSSITK